MKHKLVWLLALAVGLAGCGGSGTAYPEPPSEAMVSPGEVQPEAYPQPAATLDPAMSAKYKLPEGLVIEYTRSGGLAGTIETWQVFSDGRVAAPDGRSLQASPESLTGLLEELDTLGFFTLRMTDIPQPMRNDGLQYTLAVSNKDKQNRIDVAEGARGAPDALWKAIGLVDRFVKTAK